MSNKTLQLISILIGVIISFQLGLLLKSNVERFGHIELKEAYNPADKVKYIAYSEKFNISYFELDNGTECVLANDKLNCRFVDNQPSREYKEMLDEEYSQCWNRVEELKDDLLECVNR